MAVSRSPKQLAGGRVDADYNQGLVAYDADLEALMRPVWEDHYRRQADPELGGLTPMPRVFEPVGQVEGEAPH